IHRSTVEYGFRTVSGIIRSKHSHVIAILFGYRSERSPPLVKISYVLYCAFGRCLIVVRNGYLTSVLKEKDCFDGNHTLFILMSQDKLLSSTLFADIIISFVRDIIRAVEENFPVGFLMICQMISIQSALNILTELRIICVRCLYFLFV